jgi:kinetochore protein Spc24
VLSRQHSLAASAAQRPAGLPSAAEHDSQVGELEQTQYSVGKQLNEEQANMGKKEVELGRWKSEKEEVGKWEVGDGDWRDGKM